MIDINENTNKNLNKSNDDLGIFLPHELSDKERFDFFIKFDQVINTGAPKPEEVFSILYKYFTENEFSPYVIEKYYDTYWSIFVKLSWKILPRLRINFEVEIVARTLPYAIAEFVNVKTELSEIFILYSDEDAKLFYTQIKQKLLSLDYPISFNEYGKNITISKLVKKINESGVEKDLSRFSMFADMQKALFPDIPDNYEAAKNDTLRRTMEFIEMMYFFVKDSNVAAFKDAYFDKINKQVGLKMSKEVKTELGADILTEYFTSEENNQDLETQTLLNEKPFLTELPKHKTDFTGWITNATTLRSLLLWLGTFSDKAQARKELGKNLETALGKDSLMNNDLVLALAHLDEFLAKNGYPGDDFMHFEELSGSFKFGK